MCIPHRRTLRAANDCAIGAFLCVCVHSSHVVLRVCLPSCSKLPIHSVCHGLAQHTQWVAFVCSQPCSMSICYWDGLQCCHHPNQNKWTFVGCLCWSSPSAFLKSTGRVNGNRLHCCTFAKDTFKLTTAVTHQAASLMYASEYLDIFFYLASNLASLQKAEHCFIWYSSCWLFPW